MLMWCGARFTNYPSSLWAKEVLMSINEYRPRLRKKEVLSFINRGSVPSLDESLVGRTLPFGTGAVG